LKKFRLLLVVGVIIVSMIIIFSLLRANSYNSDTIGTIVENTDEISICKKIINKKYEILLYGQVSQLKSLYVSKYKEKIDELENSKMYEKIIKSYEDHNIDIVYKKAGNVYIIKNIVTYSNYPEEIFTTIIKLNRDKSKAVIIYDDMLNWGVIIE